MRLLGFLCLALTPAFSWAGWDYSSKTDRMTDKKIVSADNVSANNLSFNRPYQGQNYGQITVRQRPGSGTEVILSIVKGQIICSSYDCTLTVRFDNDKPITFGGSSPADHSTTAVFLETPARFVGAARKAKRILIEFNAYHEGLQTLEFSAPDVLVWPPQTK